jgi:hypothetical protein
VLVSTGGVLIVGGIILLIVLILRKKQKNEKNRKNEQQQNKENSTLESSLEFTTKQTQLLTANPSLLHRSQIPFSELTLEKEIGEGSYGKVCLGKWNAAPVAFKFCKKKGKIEEFMREIRLMMYVSI